jgi:hypothetical protein
MTNIVPNVMAQTNMALLNENYKAFQPIASGLFTYSGPPNDQTDQQIKNARTLLQNIINILPSLMQAINDTPTTINSEKGNPYA